MESSRPRSFHAKSFSIASPGSDTTRIVNPVAIWTRSAVSRTSSYPATLMIICISGGHAMMCLGCSTPPKGGRSTMRRWRPPSGLNRSLCMTSCTATKRPPAMSLCFIWWNCSQRVTQPCRQRWPHLRRGSTATRANSRRAVYSSSTPRHPARRSLGCGFYEVDSQQTYVYTTSCERRGLSPPI